MRIEAIAAGGEFTLAATPAGEQRRRRRRRRPKSARPEGATAPGGETVVAAGEGGQRQRPPREHGPRRRGPSGERREGFAREGGAPREGQRRDGGYREGAFREGQNREGQRADGQRRDGPRREGERGPAFGKGPRGKGGGKPFGKGGDRGSRDGGRDRPAPKLISFESVVDRGFEEVSAEPSGGEGEAAAQTRRVDWSIVKRTVADQRAAKAVSALYILKRDGAETEFPNLGAARAAVNKTIVHPEKLTKAKGDYVSTKK